MALTRTTLASACAVTDSSIVVASATGIAAGVILRVNGETMVAQKNYTSGVTIPVRRGQDGTKTKAHPTTSGVIHGTGADFVAAAEGSIVQFPIAGRSRTVTSYTADGAIALPAPGSDAVAILNGTAQWDMTLAVPTKDMDGDRLMIIANGKAAHTVTLGTAIGDSGAGYTVLTFAAGGQVCVEFTAANGIWCVPNAAAIAGTATNLLATIS